MNFQVSLAEQGLSVQDGLVRDNNTMDNAAQAWNDSITVSDDSSSKHSLAMIVLPSDMEPPAIVERINVFVELHAQGIHFGLSTQGEQLMALLLAGPVPRQQLNTMIFAALCLLLASVGPWNGGYGFRNDNLRVEIQVDLGSTGIQFTQLPTPCPSAPANSVHISELQRQPAGITGSNGHSPWYHCC